MIQETMNIFIVIIKYNEFVSIDKAKPVNLTFKFMS